MILKTNNIITSILCILMVTFTGINNSLCQETDPGIADELTEKIWIHTDRDFYIAGERIWFRIFLMDKSLHSVGGFSRVTYVELLDNSNKVLQKLKVKTDPSGGEGYLDIPGNIPSGYYFIRSYTSWMKNFSPANYSLSEVAVINPATGLYKSGDTALIRDTLSTGATLIGNYVTGQGGNEKISGGKTPAAPGIVVQNVKEEYGRREKVEFEITTTGADGNPVPSDISVSVYFSGDKEFNTLAIQDYFPLFSGMENAVETKSPQQPDYFFIPEMEGLTISGRIMQSSGQNSVQNYPVLQDVTVILSVVGENAFLKSYLTNADGRFYFSLFDQYNQNDLVLNYRSVEEGLVIFIDESFSQEYIDLPVTELNLDENWRSYIEKQLINYQLTSIYSRGNRSFSPDSNMTGEPFYIKPDITVRMEEFIRLPNMEEVFRELVKQVLVTRQNGMLILNILDINTNRVIGPEPLFILDGVPVFNAGLILDLDPEDIALINIVCHKYYKGTLEMDGIIDVHTNGASFPVSELPGNYVRYSFQGYQLTQKYFSPDYSDERKLKSRIPDFRNLLYWNPSIRTDAGGRALISFYTSDNTGNYSISIKGISSEGLLTPAASIFKVLK